jgi:CrcB protein
LTLLTATLTGAAGAVLRYLVSGVVQHRTRSGFPLGTLTVNLSGAILLGLVAGIDNLESPATLAASAFLAGFTTFSTWMIETLRLGPSPFRLRPIANLLITLILGVVLCAAGYSLTN